MPPSRSTSGNCFSSDAVLRESALYVSTNKGIVSLTGSVPTYDAREDAEKLAISVDDVVSVEQQNFRSIFQLEV